MAKKSKERQEKRSRNNQPEIVEAVEVGVEPIRPLNKAQGKYLGSIKSNTITFGIGPAGTGKTFVAASVAADMIKSKSVDKIILVRPAVEAGESFGFLPGELEEKYEPYMEPLLDALHRRLGRSFTDYLIKRNHIQCKPLSFMRGKDFNNCAIILDEAQNTTPVQMKMFLTRIGQNCKVIIDGDLKQKDIQGQSGLSDALDKLQNMNSCGIVEFTFDDVVRSGIVREILERYA